MLVVLVLVVVVELLVVVVRTRQLGPAPGDGQASQALAQTPIVPFFATHDVPLRLILLFVPSQQVTKPSACLPQIE